MDKNIVAASNKHHYQAAVEIASEIGKKFPIDKNQRNTSVNSDPKDEVQTDYGPLKINYLS